MKISPAYLQRRQEWYEAGCKEFIKEVVESVLKHRFGSLAPEFEALVDYFTPLEADEFIPILVFSSREELLALLSRTNLTAKC